MPKKIDDDQVFGALCGLIAARGISGLSTRDMADGCGINEATLFRRYGSKNEMVIRAANHVFSSVPFADIRAPGDLRGDLEAIVRAYVATVSRHGPLMQVLLIEVPRYPELSGALEAVRRNLGASARIVARHVDAGHLGDQTPLRLLAHLLGPLVAEYQLAGSGISNGVVDMPPVTEYVEGFLRSFHFSG